MRSITSVPTALTVSHSRAGASLTAFCNVERNSSRHGSNWGPRESSGHLVVPAVLVVSVS